MGIVVSMCTFRLAEMFTKPLKSCQCICMGSSSIQTVTFHQLTTHNSFSILLVKKEPDFKMIVYKGCSMFGIRPRKGCDNADL